MLAAHVLSAYALAWCQSWSHSKKAPPAERPSTMLSAIDVEIVLTSLCRFCTGHLLLQWNAMCVRRARSFIFCDKCYEYSKLTINCSGSIDGMTRGGTLQVRSGGTSTFSTHSNAMWRRCCHFHSLHLHLLLPRSSSRANRAM